jgi:hypothetical protein
MPPLVGKKFVNGGRMRQACLFNISLFLFFVFAGFHVNSAFADTKTATQNSAGTKQALPRELISSDPATRIKGIQIVVKNGQTEAYPKLKGMVQHDPVPEVRQYVCWAIGKLELKEGIPTLTSAMENDTSALVTIAATRALERLGVKVPPKPGPPPPEAEKKKTCKKDKDCKDNDICEGGVCHPPGKQKVTTGWALEAAIIGFVASGVISGLTIYAALYPEQLLPSIPLAAGATVVALITAPSIDSGSKSVRRYDGVSGSLTLRVLGWTCFGLHIAGSLTLAALIPLYWLNVDANGNGWTPPTSWIIGNGALAVGSVIFLSIEALIARRQALRIMKKQEAQGTETGRELKKSQTVSLMPIVSPTFGPSGNIGITAGVVGRF